MIIISPRLWNTGVWQRIVCVMGGKPLQLRIAVFQEMVSQQIYHWLCNLKFTKTSNKWKCLIRFLRVMVWMGRERHVKVLYLVGVPWHSSSCHPVTAEVSCLIRKENLLLCDTERECLDNEEKGECLNQQNNMCMTRQGQL